MMDRLVNKVLYVLKRTQKKLDQSYYKVENLPKIIFIHIPKCGGTSICKALKKVYRDTYFRLDVIETDTASDLYFETQRDFLQAHPISESFGRQTARGISLFESAVREKKCLTGHLHFNREMMLAMKKKNYHLVTMLRDPVDRFFSHYFFSYYKQNDFGSQDMSFEEYLQKNERRGSKYVQFFGGVRADDTYDSDEAIQCAVNNVKECALVGRLKESGRFIEEMYRKFGIALQMPQANKNPAPVERYNAFRHSPEKREKVKEICATDLAFMKQVDALGL